VPGVARGFNPLTAGYASGQVGVVLKARRPDIVHCIGLGPIMLGGFGCVLAGVQNRIYSPGPTGRLATGTGLSGWLARRAAKAVLGGPLRGARTRFLVDTAEDADALRLPAGDTVVVHGFGVDPDRLHPLPMPAPAPLRVAIVAPMPTASGIDVAVEAVGLARSRGADLELSLFADDPAGAKSPDVEAWIARPGVMWGGPGAAVDAPWRDCHVACLPSLGGQGTPRVLLEAAACGRALVTTDVPGCRDLVRDGTEGVLVPPGDPEALADAFLRLARDPVLPPLMGAAARARVLHDFLERDLVDAVARVYADLLGRAARA
jgi:glycosyltransferase involved in cell wall biosynthesis